jgi:putative oligomerization/nucleic acid binding protein
VVEKEAVMGLFMRPRRPVMRLAAGAATAGVAYRAGQRRVAQDQANEQASAAYQATQAAQAPAPAEALVSADSTAELERLAKLHESGALSDTEFTAAKSRLLGI